jgi:hypothetical protein
MEPEKPQTWFVHFVLDDIYQGGILVLQGDLKEAIKKCHYFSERTGATCKICALERQPMPDHVHFAWKAAMEEGMVLYEVARVNRDYDLTRWLRSFPRVYEPFSPEQRLAELTNLQERLSKELAALRIELKPKEERPNDEHAQVPDNR